MIPAIPNAISGDRRNAKVDVRPRETRSRALGLAMMAFLAVGMATVFTLGVATALLRPPDWFAWLFLPIPLAAAVFTFYGASRLRLERERRKLGLCIECGYDLRATPKQCPECGRTSARR